MYNFDLKEFRQDVLKITQEELAKSIGVRQDYISRIEKNPEAIDLITLSKIAEFSGTTLDELVKYEKPIPKALNVENTWVNVNNFKNNLVLYSTNSKIKQHRPDLFTKYSKIFNELDELILKTLVKPTVAVVGMSDSGKSRLINTLLGIDKIPTSWTPTTSISIHIKHINDRPHFIKEDVWIFKGHQDGFDVKKIYDKNYCESRKIVGGPLSILGDYGTRQGDEYIDEAHAAVAYVDSSILQLCDIVDLPGFGTGNRENDDILSQKSKDYADIVIYMSVANAFLRGNDIEFLKSTLNALPVIENQANNLTPLNNLFIVASQAHTVDNGDKKQLANILDSGANRLFHDIPEEIFENRESQSGFTHTEATLRSRFYTYTTDKVDLRENFEQDLKELLQTLPNIINQKAFESIVFFLNEKKSHLKNDISQYEEIISERAKYKALLDAINSDEPNRLKKDGLARKEVLKEISNFRSETINEFNSIYNSVINVESIVSLIKQKNYKKKKEDIERLAGFMGSKLQAQLQNILKDKSKKLEEIINQYLENFNIQISKFGSNLDGIKLPFDTVRMFASGLAGLATFGGLAFWASTLGNLGGYILVAKGVSLLSALGISISGGTAGAAAAVASFGGPVTLGIALAVIVSLSVYALASGGWQKKIAKKMVKEYNKQEALKKFETEINKFWNDTEVAFNTAANNLETEWQNYVSELSEMVKEFSVEEIEQSILNAKEMNQFLEELPISSSNYIQIGMI